MERKTYGQKIFSYKRMDEKKRRVVVILGKEKGELFWIRICTYLGENLKYREDYYKNKNFTLFNKILEKELQNHKFSEEIQRWISR